MDKVAETYRIKKEKLSPGDKFISGVASAGIPSALLTAGWEALRGGGLKSSLRGAGIAGLAGTGLGFILSPNEKVRLEKVSRFNPFEPLMDTVRLFPKERPPKAQSIKDQFQKFIKKQTPDEQKFINKVVKNNVPTST